MIKPCKELYTKPDGKYIDLMTHCNHKMCHSWCFYGGTCEDYIQAIEISEDTRWIASQLENNGL